MNHPSAIPPSAAALAYYRPGALRLAHGVAVAQLHSAGHPASTLRVAGRSNGAAAPDAALLRNSRPELDRAPAGLVVGQDGGGRDLVVIDPTVQRESQNGAASNVSLI